MATAEAFIIDPTAGMSLISTRGREREDTRYLFQAANLLDPERTQQLSYMASGGDEVATSCLRRTTNGYVPRARLTPLEVWNMSVPACHLPDGAQENTVRLVTAMTPETMGMNDAKPTGWPVEHLRRGEPESQDLPRRRDRRHPQSVRAARRSRSLRPPQVSSGGRTKGLVDPAPRSYLTATSSPALFRCNSQRSRS
jgi:hypothetical protein